MDKKRRILIVDDNAAIHNDFKKILSNPDNDDELTRMEGILFNRHADYGQNVYHYVIDDAYQGEEAYQMVKKADLEKFPYSLIFMDVRMPPGMDGMLTIERIWSEFPDIEMVICSAYSDYSWSKILEKFGPTDKLVFVRKPFNIIVIKQMALSLVTKWDIARNNRQYTRHLENLVKERTAELEKLLGNMTSLKEKAEQSDRLKSAFLSNMSHEIRSPMNAIMGFTDLLGKDGISEAKRNKYLSCIRSSGRSLMNLINDILCIARIEAGVLDINTEKFSLNHMMNELKEIFEFEVENSFKSNLRIEFEFGCEYDLMIESDSERIKQIIINLFTNAFKFTDEGVIRVGYALEDGIVRFYVSDTGIGIPESDFELIFMRFKQSEVNRDLNPAGTGIGLTISKTLSELLGGRIWVESESGAGSTFQFTVPLVRADADDVIRSGSEQKEKENFNNKTILVAEDEEVNFLLVKEMLESFRLNVLWAKNGAEAVELFRKNSDIGVILMDLRMPVMNGANATRIIKDINSNVPVIAVTAYAMKEETQKFGNLGFDDFLIKPLITADLFSKLSIWLSNNNMISGNC